VEGVWRLFRHWRPYGRCQFAHKVVVYLYIIPYNGFPAHYLYGPRFLDEPQKLHFAAPQESAQVALN
jgi:hypothetical protein